MTFRFFTALTMGLTMLLSAPSLSALDDKSDAIYRVYTPSDTVKKDVEALLKKAKASKRKALLVIGANWCKDSRSMAQKLMSKDLAPILNSSYELGYISIGYYDQAMDISADFGVPIIYGTPTVMIIDPTSKKLLNRASLHKWRDAFSFSIMETQAYFTLHARFDNGKPSPLTAAQKQALAEVQAFEEKLAPRLLAAYHHIGPQLKAAVDGNEPKTFESDWQELATLRNKIVSDMKALRQKIQSTPVPAPVVLPVYDLLSWEK